MTQILTKKIIIFSDFDGTITERDVIVMIMEKFAPTEWTEIKNKVLYERSMTLKDGIEKLFNYIDSIKKNEILDFVRKKVKIRKGFKEFIDFCKIEKIQFNVLTAGLDFFVNEVLKNYLNKLKISCNNANFSLEKIKIDYKYLPKNCSTCGNCPLCKIEIIEQYPKEQYTRILIGDSLSDLAASKVVDIVFARSDLIKYLEQDKISYTPFNDFNEVKEKLAQKLLHMSLR